MLFFKTINCFSDNELNKKENELQNEKIILKNKIKKNKFNLNY